MTEPDQANVAGTAVDHERFKNIASEIQSLMAAFGLAVAGLWVVFSFFALKSEQKAKAEIASLEFAAQQDPVLQVDLSASAPSTSASGPRIASFHAKLRNDGKRALEFEAPTLRVLRIDPAGKKAPVIGVVAEYMDPTGKLEKMPPRILRSGQARTIAFMAPLPEAGDYLVQLESAYHGMNNEDGKLVASKDQPIQALEQQVVSLK